LEAKKPFFFGKRFALCNANKFVAIKLTEVFRNGKLKVLRFVTGKGAGVSVPDTKNNTAVHFAVDIIKLLLGKRKSIRLADRNGENPQPISAEFGILEARNFFTKEFFNQANK
jgi:hypothetical protein